MESHTVKLGHREYVELNKFAGRLRVKLNRPVSLKEAVGFALKTASTEVSNKAEVLKLAGISKDSFEDWERAKKDLHEMWSKWKI